MTTDSFVDRQSVATDLPTASGPGPRRPPLLLSHAAAAGLGAAYVAIFGAPAPDEWPIALACVFSVAAIGLVGVWAALASGPQLPWLIGLVATVMVTSGTLCGAAILALGGFRDDGQWAFLIVGHLFFAFLVYMPGAAVRSFLTPVESQGDRLTVARLMGATSIVAVLAALVRITPHGDALLLFAGIAYAPTAALTWLTYFAATSNRRRGLALSLFAGGLLIGVVGLFSSLEIGVPDVIATYCGIVVLQWRLFALGDGALNWVGPAWSKLWPRASNEERA